MDLETAAKAHGEWKLKFRMAMQTSEKLDAGAIGRDNQCALGQWLHGEGKKRYGALASFTQCLHKHAAFHVEAGKVASAINAGNHAQAEGMLGGGTPYTSASMAVGGAILGLRKDAKL